MARRRQDRARAAMSNLRHLQRRASNPEGAGSTSLVLTRYEAARMCGISVYTFDVWVRKGILPGPIRGTRRWSRVSIEQALARDLVPTGVEVHGSAFEQWKRHNAH
jgi:predicted DNA-binding transcriptional regulator AlpA